MVELVVAVAELVSMVMLVLELQIKVTLVARTIHQTVPS
tara:strand:- start:273 stop:389 length:117 start_codon:yes stop_codon:yes gene_type:complete